MKLDGLKHPKVLHFASLLNISRPQAIGHLELLWAYCAELTPQGNIGKWPDGAIARACDWMEDPQSFLQALLESRLVDAHETHRLVVHDWHEHALPWVKAKLQKTGLTFVSGAVVTREPTGERTTEGSAPHPQSVLETPLHARASSSLVKSSHDTSSEDARSASRPPEPGVEDRKLSPEAALAIPLREAGVKVTSIHPLLVAWAKDGFTVEQAMSAVAVAREHIPEPQPIAAKYLDTIIRNPPRPGASRGNGKNQQPARQFKSLEELAAEAIEHRIREGWTDEQIHAELDTVPIERIREKRNEVQHAEH